MEDINFNCSHCGQNLDAPGDMVGLFVECPACNQVIKIERSVGGKKVEVSKPVVTPPPEDDKGSTMRLNLPPNLGIPQQPKHRKIIIRRASK